MNTEFLDAAAGGALEKAAGFLLSGEVVAFPTETVYGLGAVVFRDDAIQKIYEAKERPLDNPMIVHMASSGEVSRLAIDIPFSFYGLAEKFWPGPLTLVLKRNNEVPMQVSAGLDTIAVRVPDHPVARRLIELAESPLVAPSANRSGRPSPTTARHVMEDLDGRIAAVVDGGACRVGIESTVLSLVGERPRILRPGSITREALQEALGMEVDVAGAGGVGNEGSPGMKHRHYAPRAKVTIVDSLNALSLEQVEGLSRKSERILAAIPPGTGSFAELKEETFYAELRRADAENVMEIIIVCDESIRERAGFMDRIRRAAGSL